MDPWSRFGPSASSAAAETQSVVGASESRLQAIEGEMAKLQKHVGQQLGEQNQKIDAVSAELKVTQTNIATSLTKLQTDMSNSFAANLSSFQTSFQASMQQMMEKSMADMQAQIAKSTEDKRRKGDPQ